MKRRNNDQNTEFLETDSESDFKNLMKKSGVKKLPNLPVNTNKKNEVEVSDSTVFFDSSEVPDLNSPSSAMKFTDEDGKQKTTRFRKAKKLKPGFQSDIELDLHGYTKKDAIREIDKTLKVCREKKHKTLLVVTGKGNNSEAEGGILRTAVWNYLKINQKALNFKFKWAPAYLGGKGAILVFFN